MFLNWFRGYVGASCMELVDGDSSAYARHICLGGRRVFLLPLCVYRGSEGVYLEYYMCSVCGKVIVDRRFLC